jgi:Tfp pilus assembly protein PilX
MNRNSSFLPTASGRQRGAVLIISMIMLIIIALVVVSAFTLSTSNLKSVGNLQSRGEAVTAANSAIETVLSGTFLTALNTTTSINVDMNKDSTTDYTVSVAIPLCPLRVQQVSVDAPSGYETTFGSASVAGTYITDWELVATVTDAVSGAQAVIREGVRIPVGETDYETKILSCGLTLIS